MSVHLPSAYSRDYSLGHGIPMSFSNEFERLKKLRKAGLITEIEFQQPKQRLLEECVSRIEAFHEHKPTEFALGAETVKVAEEPVERPVPNPAAGKIRIPIRSDRGAHDISVKVQMREEDFRCAPRAEMVNDHV